MKITKHQLKNLIENGYLFKSRLFSKKTDFVVGFTDLLKKWPSPYRKKELGWFWQYKDYKDVNTKRSIATSQRIKFLKSLKEKNKFEKFCDDIYDFLKKYDLSFEWSDSIIDLIVSAWFFPPFRNFDILCRGAKNKKRVGLILNPDTSLEDIKDAWPEIKNKQKESWPNFKKTNVTKKSFKNLDKGIKDIESKLFGTKEVEDESDHRKYKLKDLDLAGLFWSDEENISKEADKKRMANLRQIRKRFKEK